METTDDIIHMDDDAFEVEVLFGDLQENTARWAVCTPKLFVWK